MKIGLAAIQYKNIENTVIITGPPRSGTSLLGRLVSTLSGLEYHFEPTMVWTISGLLSMKVIPEDVAALLLQMYLHEDLLCESIPGRRANLRPTDDSLILHSMSWGDLLTRWQTIRNRRDALDYIARNGSRLALKVPSVVDSVPFVARILPKAKFIVILRRGEDVVRSILAKEWLTDAGLEFNYYPYKYIDGLRIPHLVEDSYASRWVKWTPVARACYLWSRDAEFASQLRGESLAGRIHFVSYENLVGNPESEMEAISRFLQADATVHTDNRIREIREPKSWIGTGAGQDILDLLDDDLRHRFRTANTAWGYQIA